jgi:hypothetical protein
MESKGTILIVDDELGPRESLRMILNPHFSIFTAADGKEALAILRKEKIDVITLDLMRKAKGNEAKLSYGAHALMRNRHGLLVDLQVTPRRPGQRRSRLPSRHSSGRPGSELSPNPWGRQVV